MNNKHSVQEQYQPLDRYQTWRIGANSRLSVVNPSLKRIPKANPVINPTVQRHLFLLSLAWQIADIGLIVLTDYAKTQGERFDIAVAIMIFFQSLHIGLVIATSIKLCKQVMHKTASPLFVVQSFLSTILLFSGLYTLVYPLNNLLYRKDFYQRRFRIAGTSFTGFDSFSSNPTPFAIVQIFIKFLYFSTATMVTVGYGDVTPNQWYSQLMVTVEMLMSVTYTVVIFAQGLSHFNNPIVLEHDSTPEESPLLTHKL